MLKNFVTWWSSKFGLTEPTQVGTVYAVVVAGLLFAIASLVFELIGDVLGRIITWVTAAA
ncbi:hypothetical protein FPV16_20685 [Methylobacterium sp. W2]|uniref:hypothetical protein n=1 Tax=Methylobacterium sp. W2 TaxID=2598107 RepID=UPI001D0C2204|nr:hypothetical protein [Methylobacterium sp. W2]MCC0808594.1 hypothetical protein [Methylobacterium sp. W2]